MYKADAPASVRYLSCEGTSRGDLGRLLEDMEDSAIVTARQVCIDYIKIKERKNNELADYRTGVFVRFLTLFLLFPHEQRGEIDDVSRLSPVLAFSVLI